MNQQLALDKNTNDLIKLAGGGFARVTEGRYVVQSVQSRLKTRLGEWLLDPSLGWINEEDLGKNYNLFEIEDKAREIILSTEGVLSIASMNLAVSRRILTLTFTASTQYGVIDLTTQWGG